MKDRCYNQNNPAYHNYGGRGIKVCDRWLHSFGNFLDDMGKRPDSSYSLDRIDNNGDYEPDNCRWTTSEEQGRNQRTFKTNTSGQRGVNWHHSTSSWIARISVNSERITLGNFTNKEDAIKCRKEAEIKFWGKTYDY